VYLITCHGILHISLTDKYHKHKDMFITYWRTVKYILYIWWCHLINSYCSWCSTLYHQMIRFRFTWLKIWLSLIVICCK